MNNNSIIKYCIIACMLSALLCLVSSAYAISDEMREAQQFIHNMQARPGEAVEPLPEFLSPANFYYTAVDKRSPFQEPSFLLPGAKGQPDLNRPKEQLEAFTLDSLNMVGTLNKNSQSWALIAAPNGVIYRVTVGAYLGKNYGQIIKISKDDISITETVPDGVGGWEKRDITLTLTTGQ